jgi:pteridine reductase
MTEQPFSKRTALVTGATGRIGRAIALSLAAEGADVVVHYNRSRRDARTLCREIEKKGVAAWPLRADFRVTGSAEVCIMRAVRCAGRLDILVNSASLFTKSTMRTLVADDFSVNMQVNAWVPFALGRAFSRTVRRGAMVNLPDSRIAGGDCSHAGYIISKHTLAMLTHMMAREFAPAVTVNAVAPGLIMASHDGGTAARNLPLRRCAVPADVAEAVIFLLKSRCITGQVIWVDGGRHVRETGEL